MTVWSQGPSGCPIHVCPGICALLRVWRSWEESFCKEHMSQHLWSTHCLSPSPVRWPPASHSHSYIYAQHSARPKLKWTRIEVQCLEITVRHTQLRLWVIKLHKIFLVGLNSEMSWLPAPLDLGVLRGHWYKMPSILYYIIHNIMALLLCS